MRNYWLLIPPSVFFVAQVVLSLPAVSTKLGISSTAWQVGVGVCLIILFAITQFLTVTKPYKRFERFEATKMSILDQNSGDLIEAYAEAGYELRVNVMLAKRTILSRHEPKPNKPSKRKTAAFREQLAPYWFSESMRHHGDSDLVLSVRQGACGQAYTRGEPVVADLTEADPGDFNLNPEQLGKSSDLKFVLSFPIRKLDSTTLRLTSSVIGVVNVDSRTEGSEKLVQDPESLEELIRRTQALSELCSQLF